MVTQSLIKVIFLNKVIIMQNHLSIPSTVPQVQNQISEKSNMRVLNINYENNKKMYDLCKYRNLYYRKPILYIQIVYPVALHKHIVH